MNTMSFAKSVELTSCQTIWIRWSLLKVLSYLISERYEYDGLC